MKMKKKKTMMKIINNKINKIIFNKNKKKDFTKKPHLLPILISIITAIKKQCHFQKKKKII